MIATAVSIFLGLVFYTVAGVVVVAGGLWLVCRGGARR